MFLEPAISTLPCFNAIVQRVKEGQKLLDMGCAFGQELRQVVRYPFSSPFCVLYQGTKNVTSGV